MKLNDQQQQAANAVTNILRHHGLKNNWLAILEEVRSQLKWHDEADIDRHIDAMQSARESRSYE